MAAPSQQPRVYLPWWTWLTFLVPVGFLALSGWMLFLAQNSRHQDSGRALATGKLEQLERSLLQLQRGSVVLWRSAVASDSVESWRGLYRNYRSQVKQLDGTDPAIQEVMDHLQRLYAAVGRSEQIRHQVLTTTMTEPEARALETEFRSKLDVALAEVKSAMAKLRSAGQASDNLALWTGFAIASAGLALVAVLLLYLLGRQYGRLAGYEVHVAGSLSAAQTAQARCQAILNAAPDALLLLGENGRIEAANSGVQSLTGYPVAELLGRSLPEVFPSLAGGAGKAETTGQGTWSGAEIRRRDGTSQALDVLLRRTSVEGATGMLVLLRPPGKGRVEEQLRTQRDFLNSVLETADVMLAVLDERGRITSINGALERKTGLMLAQLKGQSFLSAFELEPIAGRPVRFPAPSGLCWILREEQRRRILWHGAELLGRGGAIKNVIVAGVDLTDFLPALTTPPEPSDKSLAEERRRLAVTVAQTLSDSLTAVSGYAELWLDSLGPADTARADVEQILEASRRAETVTRSMLSFARCDVLRPQTIDINMRIEALKPRLTAAAGANVQLSTALDRSLEMVRIDPERFDELLLILVRNAGEAMPEGGRVSLQTARTQTTGGAAWVSVLVVDTGAGISPETRQRLFEPFFTTKDPRRALGLGLATARGIVAQSGGTIRIDTTPGAGTSVSVLLPPAAVATPQPPEKPAVTLRQA